MTTLFQSIKSNALIFMATTGASKNLPAYTTLLRIVLWQVLVFAVVKASSEPIDEFTLYGVLPNIVLLGNAVVAIVIVQRGRVWGASVYGVISQLIYVLLTIILKHELGLFEISIFAINIVITGLLFEERTLIAMVLFCLIVNTIGIYIIEPTLFEFQHLFHELLGHNALILYVALGVVVGFFSRNSRQMIAKIAANTALLQDQISQREQAERAAHQLNDELEIRVQQRTVELSVANKELESFAYSVSHDLRAPLRGIDGWSLALLEDFNDKLNDEGRGYLAQVRTETQRMSELIDDILELSRITRSEMRRETVDLSRVAEIIVDQLKNGAPTQRVEMSIQPRVIVTGDSHLLRQVLENLLSNAWKFTSKKELAHIEFGYKNDTFFVRDDGAGFDMTYANKLFVPFQRLHRASDYAGTGVGLAIVQRIIRRHGGKIWADSQIDVGTTFYFTMQTRESAKVMSLVKAAPPTRALLSPIMEKIMEKII